MTLPFANHPLVRANNVDEALCAFNSIYRTGDIEAPGKKLTWMANAVALGAMRIAAGHVDSPVLLRSPPSGQDMLFLLSRKGKASMSIGKKRLAVARTAGVFLSPFMGGHYSMPEDYFPLTIAIDYSTLASELRALTGIHSPRPLEFECAFDASSNNGAQIWQLLRFIIRSVNQEPALLSKRLVMASLQNAFLMSLLLGHPHSHHALLQLEPKTPAADAVRRAEAYLDAHAHQPITMTELAAETGMSARALQAGFKARRGITPMAFLRERRLELARKRLMLSVPDTSVTDVALECGFRHLGRFSREYFKRFGESPSDTLRGALGKCAQAAAGGEGLVKGGVRKKGLRAYSKVTVSI